MIRLQRPGFENPEKRVAGWRVSTVHRICRFMAGVGRKSFPARHSFTCSFYGYVTVVTPKPVLSNFIKKFDSRQGRFRFKPDKIDVSSK
jgi:hypothetical protein